MIVSYLVETALELWDSCAGYCVHIATVAALEEVVGYTGYHGSVVAAEFEWREDAVDVGALGEHCAEAGISCNSAAADNCFEPGIVSGFQEFSNQSFDCCFLEGGTHVFC
jgi:hypothetical protein